MDLADGRHELSVSWPPSSELASSLTLHDADGRVLETAGGKNHVPECGGVRFTEHPRSALDQEAFLLDLSKIHPRVHAMELRVRAFRGSSVSAATLFLTSTGPNPFGEDTDSDEEGQQDPNRHRRYPLGAGARLLLHLQGRSWRVVPDFTLEDVFPALRDQADTPAVNSLTELRPFITEPVLRAMRRRFPRAGARPDPFVAVALEALRAEHAALRSSDKQALRLVALLYEWHTSIDKLNVGIIGWAEVTSDCVDSATHLSSAVTRQQASAGNVRTQTSQHEYSHDARFFGGEHRGSRVRRLRKLEAIDRLALVEQNSRSAYLFRPDGVLDVKLTLPGTQAELAILDVVYSPERAELYVSVSDHTVRVFERSGEQTGLFVTECSQTLLLSASLTRELVSVGVDHAINVWSMGQACVKVQLLLHSDVVSALVEIPAHGLLASASFDTDIHLWDHVAYQRDCTLQGHSMGVRQLLLCGADLLISSGFEYSVFLWDIPQRAVRYKLTGHSHSVVDIALVPHPDFSVLVTADEALTCRMWDLTLDETRDRIEPSLLTFSLNDDDINGDFCSLQLVPSMLPVCPTVIAAGTRMAAYQPERIDKARHPLSFLLVAPAREEIIAVGGADLHVWDATSCTLRNSYLDVAPADITAVSLDGVAQERLCAGLRNGDVVFFQLRSGAVTDSLSVHESHCKVTGLHFCDRDQTLVTTGSDGQLAVIDARQRTKAVLLRAELAAHADVLASAFSYRLSLVATADAFGVVKVWDYQHLTLEGSGAKHDAEVSCLALLEDRPVLVSADVEARIVVWAVRPAKSGFRALRQLTPRSLDGGSITALAVARSEVTNETRHVAATDELGNVFVWDAADMLAGCQSLVPVVRDTSTLASQGSYNARLQFRRRSAAPPRQQTVEALLSSLGGAPAAAGAEAPPPLLAISVAAPAPAPKKSPKAGRFPFTDAFPSRYFTAHRLSIVTAGFLPGTAVLLTGALDNRAKMWDAASGDALGNAFCFGNVVPRLYGDWHFPAIGSRAAGQRDPLEFKARQIMIDIDGRADREAAAAARREQLDRVRARATRVRAEMLTPERLLHRRCAAAVAVVNRPREGAGATAAADEQDDDSEGELAAQVAPEVDLLAAAAAAAQAAAADAVAVDISKETRAILRRFRTLQPQPFSSQAARTRDGRLLYPAMRNELRKLPAAKQARKPKGVVNTELSPFLREQMPELSAGVGGRRQRQRQRQRRRRHHRRRQTAGVFLTELSPSSQVPGSPVRGSLESPVRAAFGEVPGSPVRAAFGADAGAEAEPKPTQEPKQEPRETKPQPVTYVDFGGLGEEEDDEEDGEEEAEHGQDPPGQDDDVRARVSNTLRRFETATQRTPRAERERRRQLFKEQIAQRRAVKAARTRAIKERHRRRAAVAGNVRRDSHVEIEFKTQEVRNPFGPYYTPADVLDYGRSFLLFDDDCDGHITRRQFAKFMGTLSDADAQRVFQTFDREHRGTVSMLQLAHVVFERADIPMVRAMVEHIEETLMGKGKYDDTDEVAVTGEERGEIEAIFGLYDREGRGWVTVRDLIGEVRTAMGYNSSGIGDMIDASDVRQWFGDSMDARVTKEAFVDFFAATETLGVEL